MPTIQTLSSLKRHADHLVKNSDFNRAKALEIVSQSFGYKSYQEARDALNRPLLEFRVNLRGIEPQIWRTFLIDENLTLEDLHFHIQATMGWWTYHLYQFDIGKREYSRTCENYTLKDLRPEDLISFSYLYDFGDQWFHEVKLVGKRPRTDGLNIVCLDGARSCPREDCGGVSGYHQNNEILLDPHHPEYKATKDWSDEFQAEHFSVEEANERVDKLYVDIDRISANQRIAQNDS